MCSGACRGGLFHVLTRLHATREVLDFADYRKPSPRVRASAVTHAECVLVLLSGAACCFASVAPIFNFDDARLLSQSFICALCVNRLVIGPANRGISFDNLRDGFAVVGNGL